jgi:hypothetical protein
MVIFKIRHPRRPGSVMAYDHTNATVSIAQAGPVVKIRVLQELDLADHTDQKAFGMTRPDPEQETEFRPDPHSEDPPGSRSIPVIIVAWSSPIVKPIPEGK